MGPVNLPPQAYTREMLASAYDWLKSQPPSVRELASSANDLVALYLQSRRHTSTSPTVSSETFKSDLKGLAEDLKAFDGSQKAASQPTQPEVQLPPNFLQAQVEPAPQPQPKVETPSQPPARKPPAPANHGLDGKTAEILKHVQTRLNLSSETEALRMLVTLGYEKVRDILPKP